ncbi:histidine phosphatase family protein [Synechocystis sp. PCC 7509]|uniref:histidine phosphatase family protein n=1 Tax=Synechocystis sp. PCC 7509 TaxID=927677 RepID=UPI0002ACC9D0|nr:histidine phosphatase family protein [Synechocystis sp. PCC 7509]
MSSKLKETRVVLVRHGQSTYNALGLYQGSCDRPLLTETGYKDARLTGEFLKKLKFDAIYSSSLVRSQATAKEILKTMSPQTNPNTINFTYLLRETDLPAWEGLAFKYVRENFSQDYHHWKQHPDDFCMQLGETNSIYPALDLYQRVGEFWQEVLPRHIGQTLLIVAHGGTNRALISTALGITPNRYHCIQQSNCGISVLHFPDGSLESGSLAAMNLTTHVGECLPKLQESGYGLRLLLLPLEVTPIQQIAPLLQETKIDFSMIEDNSNAQAIAKKILEHHPETVQIKVLSQYFPENWQQGINAKNTASTFITGLVVGNLNIIKRLVGNALGINVDFQQSLQLTPGTITSIQYPGNKQYPILQVMNLSGLVNNSILDLEALKSCDFLPIKTPS